MSDTSPAAAEVLTARRFVGSLLLVVGLAVLLRGVFPTADPPWHATVGIVWHDEGAWVHNARNRALWGQWSLDAWNPMFIAPVFTALEYASFATFGVGLWQARLVSQVAGVASVLLLALGTARVAGRTAGLLAGALAASNYVYVMYNRAALMEATMVAFMVAAWFFYTLAQRRAGWGAAAGICALLAFFTKAAAAFFVAALGFDALLALFVAGRRTPQGRAALATLAGLTAGGCAALALFVAPYWAEYSFYNWQMSVTRKPSYDLRSLVDRASWFPILHDVLTRMWALLVVAAVAALAALARWRDLGAAERLLLWWVALGALELVLHDVGNERRFVFFIPAIVALAAMALARRSLGGSELAGLTRRRLLLALPLIAFTAYVVVGALVRLADLYAVGPNVRLAAALAAVLTALVYAFWPRLAGWLTRQQWTVPAAVAVAAIVVAGDLVQFAQWARGRTYRNVAASVEVGRLLPEGTLVHGKLANGLALENRIRPIFVGRQFGNYDDRRERDDIRYVLTYVEPCVGYEGPVIHDVLDAYPRRRVLATFPVAETTGGHDRAALFDKFDAAEPAQPVPGSYRACD